MLLQFNFKNFKSFRDDTTLDLTATKITEFGFHVSNVGKEKVLPVAVIYGANASGKSNVYEAFRYMSVYVENSWDFGGEKDKRLPHTPFIFDVETVDAQSSFEVYFIDSEQNGAKTYNYGFCVDATGVCEEWLNYRAKTGTGNFKRIFYRNGEELDLGGIPSKMQENLRVSLQKESLIVSLGAKLKCDKLSFVRDWFVNNAFADFGRPAENLFLSSLLPKGFVESEEVRKQVVEYLSAFDSSIIGFNVEEKGENGSRTYKVDALHRMKGSNNIAMLPLQSESAGTLKMFSLYSMFMDVMKTGGVLFVDELNARLHPLLVRNILIKFIDPGKNPKGAQLVYTSHDAWQLGIRLLRRDEIWFTEKDEDGVSSLYSLADFEDEDGVKIRKDEDFEKNYLLGKYGAIPLLKEI